jgi:arginine decarboxylase
MSLEKKVKKRVEVPLVEALRKYGDRDSARFHMPGHKGRELGRLFKDLKKSLYKWDITEIPGLDDLHQPQGPIKRAQQKLAQLYGADESFYLVNGASSGVIAMMGAMLVPGDEILISRASHRSVLSGLILTGVRPVYVNPEWDKELGVYTQVTPEAVAETLDQNPKVKAVLLTSPVYQGFCPDLMAISMIVHDKKGIFLVDEAQGPHFGFSSALPVGAGKVADAWVQSPHKMLTSFTQSAWLHVKGNRIDQERLKYFLQLVTTTSPSYIFMASLDIARAVMEDRGKVMTERALELAHNARQSINKLTPFYCVGPEIRGKKGIYDIDLSRLMVNVSKAGYSGYEVEEILRKRFNIYAEYADLYNIYFLVTFSNTKSDIMQLIKALSGLKAKAELNKSIQWPDKLPRKVMEPRDAFYSPGEYLSLKKSRGRIVKDALVPYPPGIPLLMPGEVIEKEHIKVLAALLKSGGHCQGITLEGFVHVGCHLHGSIYK